MKYIFISLFVSAVFLGTSFTHLNAQEQPQAQEQTETAMPLVSTDKPLEIWTFVDDYRTITGKILHLTVQIIWKLGITVNLEDIEKINLQPFKIEGVIAGERQIFDNEHDYMVITYALSLPADIKEGIYSIPSFSLSYRNEIDNTQGATTSSPVAIKKVPIFVDGKVDKDVITIGDRINYALTIRHEKHVQLLWENIEKLNFSPFEIIKKDIEKRTEGNIEKTSINYTLSLYELGGKKKTPEIPELTILYYETPTYGQHGNSKNDTTAIETKEIKTVPIPIIINSLLKVVDVPLEGIKGPVFYSKKHIFLHGYLPIGSGAVLLLFLCIMALRSTAKKLSTTTPKPVLETPKIALERLRTTIMSCQFTNEDSTNMKHLHLIDKALRTYVGTLMGITSEMAQSSTTSGFLSYDTQKRLSAETSTITYSVLKQLDTLIYGRYVAKEAVDKMLQGIDDIIKQTGTMLMKH